MTFLSINCILDEWINDPERRIFLIDETRKRIYQPQDDTLTLFTCVVITSLQAIAINENIQEEEIIQRKNKMNLYLKEIIRKPKSEFRDSYPTLYEIWTKSLRQVETVKFSLTTQRILENANVNTKIKILNYPLKPIISGPELSDIRSLIVTTAQVLKIEPKQIDVIIDRSDSYGMSVKQRGLPGNDKYEVIEPLNLNTKSLSCPSSFRLICGDDKGAFRNLLLLPDYYGRQLLPAEADSSKLYGLISGKNIPVFIDFDNLRWLK